MSSNLTLEILSDYFFNYTKLHQPDIERYEIEDFLDEWLDRIQAPKDARGIMLVLKNINEYTKDAAIKYRLQKIYSFPDWFIPALKYAHQIDDKVLVKTVVNSHMANGWCEKNPFYAWIFSIFNYLSNKKSRLFQILFIELYYARRTLLLDDTLSTSSQTREQEVCSAARLLFLSSNMDMDKFVQQLDIHLLTQPMKLAYHIDSYCKETSPHIEQRNVNYLRSLMHFLLEDWTPFGHRSRISRFKRRIERRYNKTRSAPIQGNDNQLLEILPALPEQISTDGLEPDDMCPVQDFALEDSHCEIKRDKRETTAAARVVDPRMQRRKAIDVTGKVRRGQNVVLQNTELLKGSELARFIHYLQKNGKRSDHASNEMVLICWLMLLLGKTFEDITDLSVFDDLKDLTQGLYLDENGNGWWCFPVAYSAKPNLDDIAKGLTQTQSFVFTPCPDFVLALIRAYYTSGLQPLLSKTITAEMLQQQLKKYSNKLIEGGRVSIDKLSNFMQRYCFASGCIDPVVLDFSYRLALTQTRVSRSYACLSDEVRQDALLRLWQAVEVDIKAADPDVVLPQLFVPRAWVHEQSVGSTFTPSSDTCRLLQSDLWSRLEKSKPGRAYPYDSVMAYHNRYVLYTTYLLMYATGYRAVHNPFPSLTLHLKTYGLLAISDKDDSDFTHARLVCVPPILSVQLSHYEEHLRSLAEYIRYRTPELSKTIDNLFRQDEIMLRLHPTEVADWYKKVKNSRTVLGPLFIFRKQNGQWVPFNISPKDLINDQPPNMQLPANAGRHWLKSQLIERKVDPEWIDWQMGHWMTGQAPLAYYSAFNHVEISSLMGEIIDELLRDIGWKSIPSVLT